MPLNVLAPAPPPPSPLGRYRLLSPTASVWVSPLCLGAMHFGEAWSQPLGACPEPTTFAILDHFFSQGGNFIDTANNYQYEESEKRIGAWMKARGNRDQLVLATKYTTNLKAVDESSGLERRKDILVNYQGNGTKSLEVSVRASLEKLGTDYIDLLYVHWYDYSTSIPEMMQSLNRLVQTGKVLYLGISDTPAWVVSKANEYARNHGLRPFSVYQGKWSAACRDLEREIIPMCRAEEMAIAPWGALGGGKFKTAEQRAQQEGRTGETTEAERNVSEVLEGIAKKKGTLVTSVAQAYVLAKTNYVFPIVGCRTVEHLKGNIAALEVKLNREEVREIEGAVEFDLGFPMNFLFGREMPEEPGNTWVMNMGGNLEHVRAGKSFGRE